MKAAESLYRRAVALAEQGDIARIKQLPVDYKALYAQAAQLEKEAAMALSKGDTEPLSRHALLRSAAALALKSGNFGEAEKLISLARSGNPPSYEAAKLDEIESSIADSLVKKPVAHFQITGTLTAANADEQEIKIRDAESLQLFSCFVPANRFQKIVKAYWQELVLAVGKTSPSGVNILEKISHSA
jgi:hypothetical protein